MSHLRAEAVVRTQTFGHRLGEWYEAPNGSIAFCKKCGRGVQVQDKAVVNPHREYLEGNAVVFKCTGGKA